MTDLFLTMVRVKEGALLSAWTTLMYKVVV